MWEGAVWEGAAREGAVREGAVRERAVKEGAVKEGAVREGAVSERAVRPHHGCRLFIRLLLRSCRLQLLSPACITHSPRFATSVRSLC